MALVHPWGFDLAALAPVDPTPRLYTGDADDLVPPVHTRWLADHVPGSRLIVYPGGGKGHMSMLAQ